MQQPFAHRITDQCQRHYQQWAAVGNRVAQPIKETFVWSMHRQVVDRSQSWIDSQKQDWSNSGKQQQHARSPCDGAGRVSLRICTGECWITEGRPNKSVQLLFEPEQARQRREQERAKPTPG